ncbi:MAG: hypothetical protein IKN59_02460 [Paludibacteraceae bacterium]|nr:hypothetical protein [Paludibacteraceae bacterium]
MKKNSILIAVIVLLVAGLVVLLIQNYHQQENINAMAETMEFEKEQLEDEFDDLALQYDGYQINISNDSLADLLAQEKQRVQDLREELRITKATDAKKINALKKELATLREVMVQYVHQIDSLDRQNKQLVQENREVKEQYQAVQEENQSLHEERTKLTEVVSRAAMMEVADFTCTPLNKRDRKTTNFKQIQKLQFDFSILKNITANPGVKTVYLRIVAPDGEVLVKNDAHVFDFENGQIQYSLKKDFEYSGEQVAEVLYWPVEEILQKGYYNADFFIDGNLVGSFPFRLE